MANVRKPIIENQVYCEILFRLGTYSYYVSEFVEHFRDRIDADHPDYDFFSDKEKKPHKEQSVLQRQMEHLRGEGYLKTTKVDEKGNKLPKNQKKYFINFDRIIEAYIDYSLSIINDKYAYNEIAKKNYLQVSSTLNDPKFRNKAKKNHIIRYLFSTFMDEIRGITRDKSVITLKKMFDSILNVTYIEDKIKYDIYEMVEKKGKKINFNKQSERDFIKKNLKTQYDFFIEFLDTLNKDRGINHFLNEILPFGISSFLVDGFKFKDIAQDRFSPEKP